jgi:hypothetical protein
MSVLLPFLFPFFAPSSLHYIILYYFGINELNLLTANKNALTKNYKTKLPLIFLLTTNYVIILATLIILITTTTIIIIIIIIIITF